MSFTNKDINHFFKIKISEENLTSGKPEKEISIMETIPETANTDTITTSTPSNLETEESIPLEVDPNLESIIMNTPSVLDSTATLEDEAKSKEEKEENEEKEDKKEENDETIIKEQLSDPEIPDSEDLDKIESRQLQKIKQIELLIKIFKLLKFHTDTLADLTNLTFPRETLIQKENKEKLLELIPELKEVYNSSYLTCLHDNSIYKQKFPAVNLVRQVLKCHHLSLTPKIISNGYEKTTGKKKVSRIFKIEKQMF